MALKALLTAEQFASTDKAQQPLYRQDGQRYLLDVESVGGFGLEDVGGLKSTMAAERKRANDSEKLLHAYDVDDTGARLDPDEARNALKLVAAHAKAKPDEKHKAQLDAVAAQWTKKYDDAVKERDGRLSALESENSQYLIDSVAAAALAKKGVNAELLLPHVRLHTKAVVVDGRRVARVFDEKGNERISTTSGSTAPMTVDELAAELVSKYPNVVPGSGINGTGTVSSPGAGGAGGSGAAVRVQSGSPHNVYVAARAQAEKAGVPLEIVGR